MKFSVALSMAVAPLALAKAVHNVYPVQRDTVDVRNNDKNNNNNKGSNNAAQQANSIQLAEANLQANQAFLLGQALGAAQSKDTIALLQQALLLWVNPGGNAATTIINIQPAATTVVVNNGGAAGGAPPPAQTPPPAGGAGGAAGQASATLPAATSGTVAATGATHSVDVGKGGLAFSPNELFPKVGDTVIFTFVNGNHTATQSAFDTPCDPLAGGMDSGFQFNVNGTVNPPPQVAMQIQVATPIWMFCRQNGHCGKGMTLSINPTLEKTQALFQSKAIQQKGTGAGTGITGGGAAGNGTAGTPPAAGTSAAAVGGAASVTATLGEAASATQAVGGAATAVAGVTTGTGQIIDGACVCAVQCASGSFASVQQGVNNFGGIPGSLPAMQAMRV